MKITNSSPKQQAKPKGLLTIYFQQIIKGAKAMTQRALKRDHISNYSQRNREEIKNILAMLQAQKTPQLDLF